MNPIDQMMQMFGASSTGALSAMMAGKAGTRPSGDGQSFADALAGYAGGAPGKFAGGEMLTDAGSDAMASGDYMFAIGPFTAVPQQEPQSLPGDLLTLGGADATEEAGIADAGTGATGSESTAPDTADPAAAAPSAAATPAATIAAAAQPAATPETAAATPASNAAAAESAKPSGRPARPQQTADLAVQGSGKDTSSVASTDEAVAVEEAAAKTAETSRPGSEGLEKAASAQAAHRPEGVNPKLPVDHPHPARVDFAEVAEEQLADLSPELDAAADAAALERSLAGQAAAKQASGSSVPSVTELADEAAADATPALASAAQAQGQQKPGEPNSAAKTGAAKAAANGASSQTAQSQQAAEDTQLAAQPASHHASQPSKRDFGLMLATADRGSAPAPTPESLTGQTDTASQSLIGGGLTALKGETALLGRPAAMGYTPQSHGGYAVNQVNIQIAKAIEAGDKQFTLRLDPPELGRVTVRLQFTQDGIVRAEVMADRRETLDLLRRDARAIEKALEAGGHKSDMAGLSFSLDDGNAHESAGKAFAEAVLADRIDERAEGRKANSNTTGGEDSTDDGILHLDQTDLEAILPYVTAETGIDVRV